MSAFMKEENISPDKNKYWFPAKKYGWGWSFPCCWQGWLIFLVWLACHGVGTVLFATRRLNVYLFVGWETLTMVAFLIVVFIKGEPPRWRWGEKSDPDKSGKQSD